MNREKTVCFTGHRPEKFPKCGTGQNSDNIMKIVKSMLYYRIYEAAQSGYEYFISGLARGVDLWAAEAVIDIQKSFPDIKLICASPFPEHGQSFRGQDLWNFNNILEKAHSIVCTSESYSKDCYFIRNRYMVDHSSFLIGVVDNFKSGTGQTISYAKKQGLKISLINVPEIIQAAGCVENTSKTDHNYF